MKKNVHAIENRETFKARLAGKIAEEQRVMFAYQLAKEAHRRQTKMNGEVRYFEDLRAGCLILMDELDIYDHRLLIAYLLHRVGSETPLLGNILEDFETWVEEITFRLNLLCPDVAPIVVGLTKPPIHPLKFTNGTLTYTYNVSNIHELQSVYLLNGVDMLVTLREAKDLPASQVNELIISGTETLSLLISDSVSNNREYRDSIKIVYDAITKELEVLKVKFVATEEVFMVDWGWDEYDGDEWGPTFENAKVYYTNETKLVDDMVNWKPGYRYTNASTPTKVKVSKEMYDAIVREGGRKKIR